MDCYSHFELKIEAKPVAFHGKTVRSSITQTLWRKIRQQILINKGHKCSICGFAPEDDNMRSLHVHEIERHDFDNGVCELLDLNLICQKCHSFHHMGRTEKVSTKEQMKELIEHFMKVNECDYYDYKDYYLEARVKLGDLQRVPTFDKVRYFISGDIPYKEDVVQQLKNNHLYSDIPANFNNKLEDCNKKSSKVIKVYKKHGM
ncbi:hypothetical protein ABET51_17155 [Metabacillus fastidiosus]|uniref:hypothetical protein n=1 Tax=Metabacillus fastidiosus TaxID=1458 RepID=UPI002E21737F|nr:hypothetical protein [Metabacillus fastidiosus]